MVPEKWTQKTLLDITKWSSGGTPSKNNPLFWGGDIPWISAISMRGHFFSDSALKVTELAASKTAKIAEKNNILLLVRGSMLWNKIPVGINTKKVSFNQDVKCITPNPKHIDNIYLLYWFISKENYLMGMVTGTGIGAGKLDTSDLQSMDILLPPLPEQKKIAQILSTWDKAITTTERLLANSQQQKKALMQQLLTGKKRLLDDNGQPYKEKWEMTQLNKLLSIHKGKQINRNTLSKVGTYAVINGGIQPSGYTESFNEEGNTITISEGGNSCGYVAFQKNKFWCGGHCYALKESKLVIEFLYQALKVNESKIMQLRVGSGLPNIQKKDLDAFKISFPNNQVEQKKIASVLSSADQKIDSLQQKIEALKQEKKALMQQLLTGKRRVKP